MADLFDWLNQTSEHPLVASCVFHYEFEFIHPFADGNGRMGRLWQTLILCKWKPLLAYLPVETVIREKQSAYYQVLADADQRGDATPFVEFMLNDLMKTLGLSHRPTFRKNYLNPALADGWIERTQPDAPRSPTQLYRLTAKGHRWLQQREKG